jgi:hypothetical protein
LDTNHRIADCRALRISGWNIFGSLRIEPTEIPALHMDRRFELCDQKHSASPSRR